MTMTLRIVTAATLVLGVASTAAGQDEKISADKLPPKVVAALATKFPRATNTTATKTRENGELIYAIQMTSRTFRDRSGLRWPPVIPNAR